MEMLKDGDASGWVMNESMDTWVHIQYVAVDG